jgi:hypothetical protein
MIYDKTTTLFPEITFTTTELVEIQKHLTQPIIKKYLSSLVSTAVKDLTHSSRKEGESAESFLERRAVVAGGLEAIEQLLAIEPPIVNVE